MHGIFNFLLYTFVCLFVFISDSVSIDKNTGSTKMHCKMLQKKKEVKEEKNKVIHAGPYICNIVAPCPNGEVELHGSEEIRYNQTVAVLNTFKSKYLLCKKFAK